MTENTHIYLRSIEMTDLDTVFRWHNDSSLYQSLGGNFRPVSRTAVEEWLLKRVGYLQSEINLVICLTETQEHIGNLYLRNIDWVARHAELHIFIGDEEHRGKGYGKAAVRDLLQFAFGTLGLWRIYLEVLVDNIAAKKVYEACGFVIEGTLRQHVWKNGALKDVFVMGVCASDYPLRG